MREECLRPTCALGGLALAMLWIASAHPIAAADTTTTVNGVVLWADCGGEDERPCNMDEPSRAWGLLPANTPSDNSSNFNDRLRCDSGLQIHVENSIVRCTNLTRMKVGETDPIFNSPWLNFARQNQFGGIQADQPIVFAPILGTHNSYSNYADGGDSSFSVDHGLSITDQLQLGARTIRLDPWLFTNLDNQIRLCHSSSGYSISALTICESKDWQGKSMSRNRSFIFAVKEIRHWLKQHPNEFIILRLHDYAQGWGNKILNGFYTQGTDPAQNQVQYFGTQYYKKVIELGLGDMVYKNPAATLSNSQWIAAPDAYRYPTIRQLRAAQKQVMVLSAFPSEWAFEDANGSAASGVTQDGLGSFALTSPADLWLINCSTRNLPGNHTPATFANLGEDRSISQLLANNLNTASTDNLMDAPSVQHSLQCGYNWIETDFLGSLSQAPNLNLVIGVFALFGIPANLPSSVNYTCDDYHSGPNCSQTDHRREAMIWSWHAGAGTPGQPARMTKAFGTSFGSWVAYDPNSMGANAPYLCANGFADASFPDSRVWYVTSTIGVWADGEKTCQSEKGADWHFWRPSSAVQNMAAYDALTNFGVAEVWLNHYVGPIQILPKTISFTVSQGDANSIDPPVTLPVSGGNGGILSIATADTRYVTAGWAPLYTSRDASQTDTFNDSNFVKVSLNPEAANLSPGVHRYSVLIHEDFKFALANPGADPQNITLKSDDTLIVEVVVIPAVAVTMDSVPSGLRISVDGSSYKMPHTFTWQPGSSHTVDASTPQDGKVRATWTSWSDGLGISHTIAAPQQGHTKLTAGFSASFLLTMNSSGPGHLTANGESKDQFYPAGTRVSVDAVPDTRGYFLGFSRDLSGAQAPQTIVMSAPHDVLGQFGVRSVIFIAGNPYSVPVIADGAQYTTPTQFYWIPGSSHTLSYPVWPIGPGKQAAFKQWLDGSGDNPRTVTATRLNLAPVMKIQWLLTTGASPAGAGQITAGGWFDDGSSVTINATANGGFGFTGFSGDLQGTANPQTISMTKADNAVANFAAVAPRINVTGVVTDDSQPDTVKLTLGFNNSGLGATSNVQVSLAAAAVTGGVTVTPAAAIPVIPSIQPGASASRSLTLNWPTSVTRIRLTVSLTANGGAYQNSQILNLFR